ncbi:hypothetical protein CPLU01_01888 [Colletotrichum plurivorum]|uniref:C2H2-type domain-containing protein n=1 Tax=Colletotrichum plurivorum TaxID=2175906 RepID=A0A8H6KYG1_9PEZI|nr:hypothetical protein CPLU01_01888 [Colletotrichum plurivorum]
MGQRTAFENRAVEAAPSQESDVAASRKQSLDAPMRTDEASRDLAVQFLRMSRAARRAIAAQYEDADTSNVDDADEQSPMAVDPPLKADRRRSSFELGSLSTLPYRPKDALHNPRKHYRGSPSVDGLEGRTGMVDERRSKRISDGSERGADFLSRCKRISNDSGYDSDARRHSRKAGEAIVKQETNALVPPLPFLCFEDYDESVKAATDSILYELRNTLGTSTPTTKRSSVRQGTPELPAPRDDEPAYQTKGLRRVRGAPTLRPENVYSRSRPQRPVVQVPANTGGSHSNEAHVSDTIPRRWSPTSTSDIRESRPMGRSHHRLSSGPPAVSSVWSASTSRPHSAVVSPIEEHSDSAIESDDGTSSSFDSSVFSIPDSPIEPSQLHPDDPFAPHLDTVVSRILQKYRTHQTQRRGGQAGRRSTQQGTSSTPDSSRHSRKRSHSGDPDDRRSPPNDPNAPPDSKRPKLPTPTTAGRHLACPFWKRDPENHRHCYKKVLSRVKYVKQHLYRFHEAPISCACCGAEFSDERLRDEHVRARRCLVVERRGFFSGGMTRAQRLEVSRRANPKESEEEQWFAIWDVIFPGEPRPVSAYVDAELSQDLCAYREFHAREGADILLAYLAACDPVVAGHVERSASHDRAVLSRALDSIYDHWAARRGLRAPPADLPTPPQTEPSDAASRVSLAYAPEGPAMYSYAADDVPAGDLPFADRGLEGLAQRQEDVYLGPDPRALMADLDNMFASVDDDDDFVPGVY